MRKSTYDVLGIPMALAGSLSLFALALALTPFLGGADFGVVKIPVLSASVMGLLKWIGPALLALLLSAYLPTWHRSERPRISGFLPSTEAVSMFERIVSTPEMEKLNLEVHLHDGTVFSGCLSGMASGGPDGYVMTFRTISGQHRHVTFRELVGVKAAQQADAADRPSAGR